jgi:hypothetical protein
MNSRSRQPYSRRAEQTGPRFCSRCGGALSAQGGINPTNVCRCTKEDRARHEGAPARTTEDAAGQ